MANRSASLRIPVMKVVQEGRTLYLGKMTAQEMLDFCVTTEWDPNLGWDLNNQGYQRVPNRKHYVRIGNFLESNPQPFMPTAGLLSARESYYGRLDFERIGGGQDIEFGFVNLAHPRPLFIVDYQHRWHGFMYAIEERKADRLKRFNIPVVIIADVPRPEEIQQFYLINSKQKRIDTDLALTLLQTMAGGFNDDDLKEMVGPGYRYRVRATRLTFQVAAISAGPWTGKIVQPHDDPQPTAVISIKAFVDSLKPIVSIHSPVAIYDDAQILSYLTNYWGALYDLMPEAFASPRQYQLQRTLGTNAWHRVAAKQISPICIKADDFSRDHLQRIFQSAGQYVQSSFWLNTNLKERGYGSSSSAQIKLTSEIIGALTSGVNK